MKRAIIKLNSQGVTLIELLLVMGLLSIMLVILATIFTSAADIDQRSKDYSATLSNGQFIMARLNYDIGQATAIVTPTGLGNSAGSLALTIGGNTDTYALSGNDLQLNDGVSSVDLNDSDINVSGLNFEEVGNSGGEPTIVYNFTVTSTTADHGVYDTETYSSAAGLR
jgi:prepilin-type N-terminal cleavage/methylation domain-containing protein